MKGFSSRPWLLCTVSVLITGVMGSTQFVYPQDARSGNQSVPDGTALELLHVQGNISVLAGAGGNITVQIGNEGILLVDSGAATMSDKILQTIRTASNGQVTYIVNTNERSDHVGGNANFARLGRPLA